MVACVDVVDRRAWGDERVRFRSIIARLAAGFRRFRFTNQSQSVAVVSLTGGIFRENVRKVLVRLSFENPLSTIVLVPIVNRQFGLVRFSKIYF